MSMSAPRFLENPNKPPPGTRHGGVKSKQRGELPDGAYIVGVMIDITVRKRVEEALRASEESHRLLAENSSDMILRITPKGKMTYVSPASLGALGYRPDELTGRSLLDFIHPDDAE